MTMKAEIAPRSCEPRKPGYLQQTPRSGERRGRAPRRVGEQGWEPPRLRAGSGRDVTASSEVPPSGSETMYAFLLVLLK